MIPSNRHISCYGLLARKCTVLIPAEEIILEDKGELQRYVNVCTGPLFFGKEVFFHDIIEILV